MPTSPKYDVVVLGATGFTGKLAAQYLSRHYSPAASPSTTVRWAIAGRSASKLDNVLASLASREGVEKLVCDVTDLEALERVISSTRVVANYAGTPFIDKALPVVELCAKHGTHYVDITGEVPLHRESYDKHHEACVASQAVVLHGCGFDSVPSDLGAFMAASAMRSRHGCGCSKMTMLHGSASGGFSGGTLATVLALMAGGNSLPGASAAAERGAYALDPAGATGGPDTGTLACAPRVIGYNDAVKKWTAPFVMAPVNAPVVRKSNALLSYTYGRSMAYSEVAECPSLPVAALMVFGLSTAVLSLAVPPVRGLLFKLGLLPRPGEGPSKAAQDAGYFNARVIAHADGGAKHVVTAHVQSGTAGDPGYKATALMSIESALCLALQREKCDPKGGVLTPASALGQVLVDRLNAAGMKLYVE